MRRLINIEYLKLRHHRATWILLGLYFVTIAAAAFGGGLLMRYLADQGVSYQGLDPTILPIYDFADIWQNLAYMASFFKIFPAFLLMISISNEFTYKTHRQNIIDGMSRRDFFLSKMSFAAFLAIASGLFLLLIGLTLGGLYSPVRDFGSVTGHLFFIPVHILQLFIYFLFAIFIVLLIRRSGISIVALLMYGVVVEPILYLIIKYKAHVSTAVLPLDALSRMVPMPFGKYVLQESQDYITPVDFLPGLAWGLILVFFIFRILKSRDF